MLLVYAENDVPDRVRRTLEKQCTTKDTEDRLAIQTTAPRPPSTHKDISILLLSLLQAVGIPEERNPRCPLW